MFSSNSGNVAARMVLAILAELEHREPGFARVVEARLNSAANSASGREFGDAQAAAEMVRDLTS